MHALEAKHLTKSYLIGDREIPVLKNLSFSVGAGEFLVVEGASGSGKTTLLTLLSGLDRPTSGSVWMGKTDITDLREDDLAPLRNKILGFVFQSFHLVPSLNAIENVMLPAELKGDAEALAKAETLMRRVGLEQRQFNYPHQLSGGEKQRVALCRALVNKPEIIFADEPTGNLDSENSAIILNLLLTLRQEHGATLVMVTHSPDISTIADRTIILRDGRIVGERRHAE
jgi:putative ABC transport system ATP-binding protein